MIAIESFKRFRFIDILVIVAIALLWMIFSLGANKYFGPQFSYGFSLILATTLMAFTVHLVRKAGAATLFYALGGLLSMNINDLGATGMDKVFILIIAGIIFELVFIIFKLELKNIQLDIILATAISSASIPLSTSIFLAPTIAMEMLRPAINLILYSFFIGLIGAVISFIIWYSLRTTKFVLRFEYS